MSAFLPSTVLLDIARAEPRMPIGRHLSGWAAWQTKFNEKEKTEKLQFADDFKQKLQLKQREIQNLMNTRKQEL